MSKTQTCLGLVATTMGMIFLGLSPPLLESIITNIFNHSEIQQTLGYFAFVLYITSTIIIIALGLLISTKFNISEESTE